MRWTTRLKRHGGLVAITNRRAFQFQMLAAVPSYSRRGPMAADNLSWLEEHPLRLLNRAEEGLFS